jgi:curved DNA-binding protein CbpA
VNNPSASFVDYYELMQISPNAEMETIQRVYRMLAGRYHPDNGNTGDMERFLRLNEAYQVLSDPQARAEYDADYRAQHLEPIELFNLRDFAVGIDGEGNRRMGLLCLLYNRRRMSVEEPGLSLLEFEKLMTCPREHLVFTIWYLKDKDYLRQTEDSSYAITASGVEYVEAGLPKNRILYKLIKEAEDGAVHSAPPRAQVSTEEARA